MYASVGAITVLLAQLAWLASSLHESARAAEANLAARYSAFGVNVLAIALSLGALYESTGFVIAAAAASIVSTGVSAWYASTLKKSSVLAKSGYGAALFSTVAAVLLLSIGLDNSHAAVIVIQSLPLQQQQQLY
jgi:hypothetical protein